MVVEPRANNTPAAAKTTNRSADRDEVHRMNHLRSNPKGLGDSAL
jgi:hypothetical protein